ncbi:DnaJ heat shock amino-terminal domain-like protein [Trifolium medium]|uniref:DnaJ heat shock amino-terminal domain-like protein n=1 Tax=Trifolium medium TaxID=97028 RepID=A0A392MXS8_9FABA|nr:DnaJ heat shock amino-terminal domain-like protein [Trifolium medium]
MILDKKEIAETHYEVLNVKEDANYQEICASYRSTALSLHPDKLLNTSSSNQTSTERFLKVHKAWEVLSDSNARLFYDKELQCSRREDLSASEVAEDLRLHDMMTAEDVGEEALELFYQCRCGDYFSVDSLELQKMGYTLLRDESSVSIRNADTLPGSVILPCGSCSLKALLVLSMDDS